MRQIVLAILLCVLLPSGAAYAQLFKPLGLGIEISTDLAYDLRPQMYIDGNILYAGTKQGLYTKDLSQEGSEWQLVGFEGVPIMDFVRKGDDIYALCFDKETYEKDIFLTSHDGGKTYEDVTPKDVTDYIMKVRHHVFWYFAKHPTDPNVLLLSSSDNFGIMQTSDFGRSWTSFSNYTPNPFGYNPFNPDIIYECHGGGFTSEKTDLRISYDGGQTWEAKANCFPDHGEIYHIAFHPTNPNRWIAGGKRSIHITDDNGKTWENQDHYDIYNSCRWEYIAFDNKNANIVYAAEGRSFYNMNLICSTDGGTSWTDPYREPIKDSVREWIFDMKQYKDKLLIYTQKDIYEISKAELLEATTSVRGIAAERGSDALYDLTGRRMTDTPKKGIYIKDGKKFVRQ